MYEVIFYATEKGECPTDDFLDTLQRKVRAKVEKWIEQLERHGPDLPRPYADVVHGKIRELRISFGPNKYRLLYFFYGKKIMTTHGFMKKTPALPVQEIERAERAMHDFLQRHKGGNEHGHCSQ